MNMYVHTAIHQGCMLNVFVTTDPFHELAKYYSGTPPYRHPRNAAIYDNVDTSLSLEPLKCYSVKQTLGLAQTVSLLYSRS